MLRLIVQRNHFFFMNCHYERLHLARGICFYSRTGEQQIPRYARDDNSFRTISLMPRVQTDLFSVTISLKSAMVENSLNKSRSSARRLARTVSSSTITDRKSTRLNS